MRRGFSAWRIRRARLLSYLVGERRIGARAFFAHVAGLLALAQFVQMIFGPAGTEIYAPLLPLLFWPDAIARLHDSGRSGLWSIVPVGCLAAAQRLDEVLPLVGHAGLKVGCVFLMIGWGAASLWLLVQAGHAGPNRYGPDPRRGMI